MKATMFTEFNSLKDLSDHFKTQSSCLKYVAWKRWMGIPKCPYCDCTSVYHRRDGRYACGKCKNSFSVLVGTVFQNTKLPLLTWFKAIFLVCNSKQGISSCQLSLILGITQKTAWFILHKIRLLLRDSQDDFHDRVQGTIEQRESEKGNCFRIRVVDEPHQLHPGLIKFVEPESRIFKDPVICFQSLSESECLEYAVEDPYPLRLGVQKQHDRRILDVFWLQLKRMVMGVYHFVTAPHFHRYVYEALFRKKHMRSSMGIRFSEVLGRIEQVLPYRVVSPK